jgi:hypothetical protein
MQQVINILIFNFISIMIFTVIYMYLPKNSFTKIYNNEEFTLIDYFSYSTTIQAGIGLSDMTRNNQYAIVVTTIQQLVYMTSYALVVYLLIKI